MQQQLHGVDSLEVVEMSTMRDENEEEEPIEEDPKERLRLIDEIQNEEEGEQNVVSPWDHSLAFLGLVLFCISFLAFGSYFAYDAVSALEVYIKEDLRISSFQFGLLFSIYSFPNIGLVLVGGYIIDKMGNAWSSLLFCGLLCLGSGVVAFSSVVDSWIVMLIGRLIFAIGAESSYVVQNNLCIEWFSKKKYFAFLMGIVLTVSRAGSISAFSSMASVASSTGSYKYALFVAFLVCSFSFFLSIVYFLISKYSYKRASRSGWKDTQSDQDLNSDQSSFKKMCINPRAFSGQYWLWATVTVTIYSTIFPFLGLSSGHIVDKYHVTPQKSGFYLAFIDFTALALSPLFAWLVDITGKKGIPVTIGNSLAVIAYLILGLTDWEPMIATILLGLHFALMPAVVWPCLPLIVDEKHTALAFAIVSSLMNASLTGMNSLGGWILEHNGFHDFCLLLTVISLISVIASLVLNFRDMHSLNPVLNRKDLTQNEKKKQEIESTEVSPENSPLT